MLQVITEIGKAVKGLGVRGMRKGVGSGGGNIHVDGCRGRGGTETGWDEGVAGSSRYREGRSGWWSLGSVFGTRGVIDGGLVIVIEVGRGVAFGVFYSDREVGGARGN